MGGGSSAMRGRIMVVDDDAVTARFMAHVLGKRGGAANARRSSNGPESGVRPRCRTAAPL